MQCLDAWPCSHDEPMCDDQYVREVGDNKITHTIKGKTTYTARCVVPPDTVDINEEVVLGDHVYFITGITPGKKADELTLVRYRDHTVEEKLDA